MEGRPFAIIGINGDNNREQLRATAKRGQIPWRNVVNERKDQAAVAQAWSVRRWPTTYLIDHQGVIRARWLNTPAETFLEPMIEESVKEAEAQSGSQRIRTKRSGATKNASAAR